MWWFVLLLLVYVTGSPTPTETSDGFRLCVPSIEIVSPPLPASWAHVPAAAGPAGVAAPPPGAGVPSPVVPVPFVAVGKLAPPPPPQADATTSTRIAAGAASRRMWVLSSR